MLEIKLNVGLQDLAPSSTKINFMLGPKFMLMVDPISATYLPL
jgi:hypothetical protein